MKNAVVLSVMLCAALGLLSACADSREQFLKKVVSMPGGKVFESHCVSCHGEGMGVAVVIESKYLASEADFIQFLRKPTTNMMPPFSAAQLSDADAGKLYEYLAALSGND